MGRVMAIGSGVRMMVAAVSLFLMLLSSAGCWADTVAHRLECIGYDCYVLDGGFESFAKNPFSRERINKGGKSQ